jgi:hypothetical protein
VYGCEGTAMCVHFITVTNSNKKTRVSGSAAKDKLMDMDWRVILQAHGSVKVRVMYWKNV